MLKRYPKIFNISFTTDVSLQTFIISVLLAFKNATPRKRHATHVKFTTRRRYNGLAFQSIHEK